MNNYVDIVLDSGPLNPETASKSEIRENKVFYPLEKNCRSLGQLDDTYVMAIFDCCREARTPEMVES